MKSRIILLFAMTLMASVGHAEEDFSSPEEKAERAHQRSISDVIYQQEDFKALYYQNEAIIQLLKEIRDEMRAVKLLAAKEKV